jgi:hypothetical protein
LSIFSPQITNFSKKFSRKPKCRENPSSAAVYQKTKEKSIQSEKNRLGQHRAVRRGRCGETAMKPASWTIDTSSWCKRLRRLPAHSHSIAQTGRYGEYNPKIFLKNYAKWLRRYVDRIKCMWYKYLLEK